MQHFWIVSLLLHSTIQAAYSFPEKPMQRALLFDIDGTLSDSFRLGFESTQRVLTLNGYKTIDEAEYHQGVLNTMQLAPFLSFAPPSPLSSISSLPQGTRYTTPARLSWHSTGEANELSPIGVELGRQFDEMYVELVSTETAPLYDGIAGFPPIPSLFKAKMSRYPMRSSVEMIRNVQTALPGLKLGALSNACGSYVEAVLRVNRLSNDFGVALGADQVPGAKPKPDGLLQCCKALSVDPASCIYVGDSPTDGQAAAAAGMPSIGVTWVTQTFTRFTHLNQPTKLLSET